jgi:murein L,D-transpeptidase YcbB/YkuD
MNISSIAILLAAYVSACTSAVPVTTAAPAPASLQEAVAPPPVELPSQIEALPADLQRLQAAIAAYEAIAAAGGWPVVPSGQTLRPGDQDARIIDVRKRLFAGKDLLHQSDSEIFDQELAAAVQRFQQRHGLEEDGLIGRKTLQAMNVPISQRIATLRYNLQRIQRENRVWGDRFIAVNAAATTYRLVENGTTVFERRVIVGRPNWQTPLLNGAINEIVLHPTWTVPPRIARLELLPRIKRDAGYLARQNMRWVDGMIQQAPGPGNPLGKVKFVFPNDDSIYLHDTNAPSLFELTERFLSHGCIRLSNAEELAHRLLDGEPGWNAQKLTERFANVALERVRLTRPIPVHIVYDTAWVDPAGTINFRDDVYGLDRP